MRVANITVVFCAMSFFLGGAQAKQNGNLRYKTNKSKSTVPSSSTLTTSSSASSPPGSLFGYLEFRPSYGTNAGELHSENTAEAGYKFNSVLKVGYIQFYSNNLMNNTQSVQGLNLLADEGRLYFSAKKFWESENKTWSLSYKANLLAPTNSNLYNAGYITGLRNELKVAYKHNDYITTELTYVPIVHTFSRAGSISSQGSASSNKSVDHQLVFNQEIHPADKFTLYLPVIWISSNYREFSGASNSGKWKKNLIFLPELDYDINAMHTIGVSYYTDNCASPYGQGLNLDNGFRNGIVQLIWGINL